MILSSEECAYMVVDDYAMSNYFTRLHTFFPSSLHTYILKIDLLLVIKVAL
jgi:hypothetical protein